MATVKETIGTYIDKKCIEVMDKEAMVFGDSRYTFGQFRNLYISVAKGLLKLGVKKGQRVALISFNSPIWLALQVAASKIGAILVCMNTGYTKNEMEYVLHHSGASTLILGDMDANDEIFSQKFLQVSPEIQNSEAGNLECSKLPDLKNIITLNNNKRSWLYTFEEFIESGKDISTETINEIENSLTCDDVVSIQYTSGTTGNPKAVMSTNFTMINNALVTIKNMSVTENDRILLCLPLYHVIGCVLTGILSILCGSTLIILDRFHTEKALRLLEKEQCTIFNGVPTMFTFMLDSPNFLHYDLSHLRTGFIAGSYCKPSLMEKIMDKLGIQLCNVYGQTEAISIAQTVPSDSFENLIYTIGRPLEGVSAKIINHSSGETVKNGIYGELCIKTIYLMKGYYHDDLATAKAVDKSGWLHTGDLAMKDNDGYLRIVGRIKDIIIRGGENIAPTEIENVVRDYDGVSDVAVVGVPDEVLGEEICMFVICDKNKNITADSLKELIHDNLAKFKIPKYVEFINSFPLTSSGKVRKFVLRAQAVKKYNLTELIETKKELSAAK